jgi:hypothetical protein
MAKGNGLSYGDIRNEYGSILRTAAKELERVESRSGRWIYANIAIFDAQMETARDILDQADPADTEVTKFRGYVDELQKRAAALNIDDARKLDLKQYASTEELRAVADDWAMMRTTLDSLPLGTLMPIAEQLREYANALTQLRDELGTVPDLPDKPAETLGNYAKMLQLIDEKLGVDGLTKLLELAGKYGDKLPAYLQAWADAGIDDPVAFLKDVGRYKGRLEALEKGPAEAEKPVAPAPPAEAEAPAAPVEPPAPAEAPKPAAETKKTPRKRRAQPKKKEPRFAWSDKKKR